MVRARRTRAALGGLLVVVALVVSSLPAAADPIGDAGATARTDLLVRLRVATTGTAQLTPLERAEQADRIAAAQAAVLDDLDGEVQVRHRFRTLPTFSLSATSAQRAALATDPRVASVDEVPTVGVEGTVEQSTADVLPAHLAGWGGGGKVIAVIDTGIDINHPAFAGALRGGACFVTLSSSRGGCAGGAKAVTGSPSAAVACATVDQCWHGTHVAGIAAGRTPAGVANRAQVLPIRIFGDYPATQDFCGGKACINADADDEIAALEYVLQQKQAGVDVVAANLSLSHDDFHSAGPCDHLYPGTWVEDFYDLVADLRAEGVAVVGASGNQGFLDETNFPACLSNVVSVGATEQAPSERMSEGANVSVGTTLLAPGQLIESARPGGGTQAATGTSMAAPMVAGALALAAESRPDLSIDQLIAALVNTGPVFKNWRGSPSTRLSKPRLDVRAAMTALVVPEVPPSAAGTRGLRTATLTWGRAGVRAPGHPVDGYVVQDLTTGRTATAAPDAVSFQWDGLSPGRHRFTVAAHNTAGTGPASPPVELVIVGEPSVPLAVRATSSPGSVELTWSPPSSNGSSSISGYEVALTPVPPSGEAVRALGPTARATTFDALEASTTYTATVRAQNVLAFGPAVGAMATTPAATAPGAPTSLVASGEPGAVVATWGPPATSAPSVVGFVAELSPAPPSGPAAVELASSARSVRFEGLVGSSSYTVTVRSVSSGALSLPASATASTPSDALPAAPRGVSAIAGSDRLDLRWAPAPVGAAPPVLGYQLTVVPAPAAGPSTLEVDGATSAATIGGLVAGQGYVVSIRARNRSGLGAVASVAATTTTGTTGGQGGTDPVGVPGRFEPMSPRRLLDTRGSDLQAGALGPDAEVVVPVAAALGRAPGEVAAVAMTVTLVDATAPGYVTAWPGGTGRPATSSLNADRTGQTVANLVVVPVGADGTVRLYTQAGGHLLADVAGTWSPATSATAGRFTAVAPDRLLDTRGPSGVAPRLSDGGTIDVQVTGRSGVPAEGVSAVVLTVTATDATAAGYVTAWPTGTDRPNASNLNLERAGQTVPDLVVVPVGLGGKVSLYLMSSAHLVVDVAGWFTDGTMPDSSSGLLVPVPPARAADTRAGDPVAGPGPDGQVDVAVAGRVGIPVSGATAVVGNLTGTEARGGGYVTLWPGGSARPGSSNLNLAAQGQTVANGFAVPLGSGGTLSLYTQTGTQLILDVTGWFTG